MPKTIADMGYCTNLFNDRTFFMRYRNSDMRAVNSDIRICTTEVGYLNSDMPLCTAAIGYPNSEM